MDVKNIKIQKIKQHLFLNDKYPAILFEDNTIKIMLQMGDYIDKDFFLNNVWDGTPIHYNKDEIMELFNYDYSNINKCNMTLEIAEIFRKKRQQYYNI